MVVKKSKNMTLFIKITSILIMPLSIVIITASIYMLASTRKLEELLAGVFFLCSFLWILVVFVSLFAKVIKSNKDIIKIEKHEIVIDAGFKIHRLPITSLETFTYIHSRGLTKLKVKVKNQKMIKVLHVYNLEELEIFQRFIRDRIGKV